MIERAGGIFAEVFPEKIYKWVIVKLWKKKEGSSFILGYNCTDFQRRICSQKRSFLCSFLSLSWSSSSHLHLSSNLESLSVLPSLFLPPSRVAVKCLEIEVRDFCSYLSRPRRKELAAAATPHPLSPLCICTHSHTHANKQHSTKLCPLPSTALGFRKESAWFRLSCLKCFFYLSSISFASTPSISDLKHHTHTQHTHSHAETLLPDYSAVSAVNEHNHVRPGLACFSRSLTASCVELLWRSNTIPLKWTIVSPLAFA